MILFNKIFISFSDVVIIVIKRGEMTKFLQGTYDLDIKIIDDGDKLKDEFNEKAKASVGGSMVFLEKKKMVWKGDEPKRKLKKKNS